MVINPFPESLINDQIICYKLYRIITGFALDELNGMGITSGQPGYLEVSQPFYVKLDLPRSVKQGETLAVEMVKT